MFFREEWLDDVQHGLAARAALWHPGIDGGSRRHLVVCGSEGTFHIQPLDDPTAIVSLSQARGPYKKGRQEIKFPKYERYVDDAADMAKIIRGEKSSDFSYAHDLLVQSTLLQACRMPLDV